MSEIDSPEFVSQLANDPLPGAEQRVRDILDRADESGMLWNSLAQPLISLETIAEALSAGNVKTSPVVIEDFLQSSPERRQKWYASLRASKSRLEHMALTAAINAHESEYKTAKLRVDTFLKVAALREVEENDETRQPSVPFVAVLAAAPQAIGQIIDGDSTDADYFMLDNGDAGATAELVPTNEAEFESAQYQSQVQVKNPNQETEPVLPHLMEPVNPDLTNPVDAAKRSALKKSMVDAPVVGGDTAPSALEAVQHVARGQFLFHPDETDEYGEPLEGAQKIDRVPHIPEPNPDSPVGLPDLPPVTMNPADYAKIPGQDGSRSITWDEAPVDQKETINREAIRKKFGFR